MSEDDIGNTYIPLQIRCAADGFSSDAEATTALQTICEYIGDLRQHLELTGLDGITVSFDYHQALSTLDRGFQAPAPLQASTGVTQGIAMTTAVLRDGAVKSHLVFDAQFILPILDEKSEYHSHAVHILAHECGHVMVNSAFERSFPGDLLGTPFVSMLDSLRDQVMQACWDEFAVTSLTAEFGENQTRNYEHNFITFFNSARLDLKNAHRVFNHSDGGADTSMTFIRSSFGAYGNLLKYAAYHLGNLHGQGIAWRESEVTFQAVSGSWFEHYLDQLDACLKALMDEFGVWENRDQFERIGDILLEMFYASGVSIRSHENGGIAFDFNASVIAGLN